MDIHPFIPPHTKAPKGAFVLVVAFNIYSGTVQVVHQPKELFMCFEAGMHCPICAKMGRESILVANEEDDGVLQCPDRFCLMLFINLPNGQIAVPEKPSGVMH